MECLTVLCYKMVTMYYLAALNPPEHQPTDASLDNNI